MPRSPVASPTPATLRFWHQGSVQRVGNVPPDRTLLDLLREDLRLSACKEGCAAGDCGACTVVLADRDAAGGLRWRAVNSCIKPAQAIDGMALYTAADLGNETHELHPVQSAMVEHHASQCGFCTPGFVMTLFALYQSQVARGQTVERARALHALSGNLCRCTGYRPIVAAACALRADAAHAINEPALAQALKTLADEADTNPDYLRPKTLKQLLQARARHRQATLLAGATDLGLTLTQGLQRLQRVIDLTRVAPLQRIEHYPQHLALGAAVTLEDAFDALAQQRPAIAAFAQRFAGWPIRQSGTLAGNIANASPIGDSMPLLIALGAQLVLMAWRRGRVVHRHIALEDFYTGYRQTRLATDEVIAWVVVPNPSANEWLGVYKVAKRQEDDISAVCLVLQLQRSANDARIAQVRIGAGGVAATPARARQTEAALRGKPFDAPALARAQAAIGAEFTPIGDLRASAAYRQTLLQQLLRRAWLEQNSSEPVTLEALR